MPGRGPCPSEPAFPQDGSSEERGGLADTWATGEAEGRLLPCFTHEPNPVFNICSPFSLNSCLTPEYTARAPAGRQTAMLVLGDTAGQPLPLTGVCGTSCHPPCLLPWPVTSHLPTLVLSLKRGAGGAARAGAEVREPEQTAEKRPRDSGPRP